MISMVRLTSEVKEKLSALSAEVETDSESATVEDDCKTDEHRDADDDDAAEREEGRKDGAEKGEPL